MNTKLNAALVAAIAELRNVQKDKTNPHFKSKFASLDAIIDATRPVLAKHGLAIVQMPEYDFNNQCAGVTTRVIHTSGESSESKLLLPVKSNDPMACGSAISYSRRYSMSAVLMICADEDDDGVSASTPTKSITKPVIAKPEFSKKPAPALEPTLPQNALDMLFSMMHTNKVTEEEVRSFCLSKGMKDVPEFVADLSDKVADRLVTIFPEVIEFSINK